MTSKQARLGAVLALLIGLSALPAHADANRVEQHPYLVNPDGSQGELRAGDLCVVCPHQFIVSAKGKAFSIVIDDEVAGDGMTVPYELKRGNQTATPFETGCITVGAAKSFAAMTDNRDIRVNISGLPPEISGCTARGWVGIATVTISG